MLKNQLCFECNCAVCVLCIQNKLYFDQLTVLNEDMVFLPFLFTPPKYLLQLSSQNPTTFLFSCSLIIGEVDHLIFLMFSL
jgi:hypothetical protein